MSQLLTGRTALVTGASSGIGRATALLLARSGADVATNYLTHAPEASQLADEVRALGQRALLFQADVADQASVEYVVDRIVAEWGRLDMLVANAFYSDEASFHTAEMAG